MDARTRYTKRAIRESFLKILEEKPIDKITVTKICELAEINRATFYRYYDNPANLLDAIEAEELERLMSKLRSVESKNIDDYFMVILRHIIENLNIFKSLATNRGGLIFRQQVFGFCHAECMDSIKHRYPMMSESQQEALFYFIAEGCIGVLNYWQERALDCQPEIIVAYLHKLIASFDQTLPAAFNQ